MKNTPDQDELRIRYILGDLPEDEQVTLEEKFFTDDEAYQQLVALEDELRYEYSQGGLTPDQRTSFERRFLRTPEDREKVDLARALLDKAYEVRREAALPQVTARVPETPMPLRQRIAGWFALGSPVMQYGMAAAALLLLSGGSWLVIQNVQLHRRIGDLEAQQRVEGQRDLARQAEAQRLRMELAQDRDRRTELERQQGKETTGPVLLSFLLTPGLVRDSEGPKRLVVPVGTKEVRLQLGVKPDAAVRTYRVSLQTLDGAEVWKQDVSRTVVNIPGRLLPPGDYLLNLKGLNAQGDSLIESDFYFSVTPK